MTYWYINIIAALSHPQVILRAQPEIVRNIWLHEYILFKSFLTLNLMALLKPAR